MEDLAVTAMTTVLSGVLEDLDEAKRVAELLISSAQDVRYDTRAGNLTVTFIRDELVR
ncbi:hypothetical protein [Kribbella jiaozuonensis]|uniref:hypothetical protein n=1 Tax=Kribbella jiaozuonensis TaxID=2575441 RepID=UPI0014852641|nr:hypothetical protein [Kribbella jiaozuonensis]